MLGWERFGGLVGGRQVKRTDSDIYPSLTATLSETQTRRLNNGMTNSPKWLRGGNQVCPILTYILTIKNLLFPPSSQKLDENIDTTHIFAQISYNQQEVTASLAFFQS